MRNISIANRLSAWLPKLAVTTVLCWALGTNTYLDNKILLYSGFSHHTPTVDLSIPVDEVTVSVNQANAVSPVLSAHDVNLYKIIFAAQAKNQWAVADDALAQLSDKSLVGHVLADRYRTAPVTLADLQSWLQTYADFPEAGVLHARVVTLAGKSDTFSAPEYGNVWSGSNVFGTSVGFHAARGDHPPSPAITRFEAKINQLIHKGNATDAEVFLDTENHHPTVPLNVRANAEGLIAAAYFYKGNILAAHRLASEGAKQQNPLALWIDGLTAWKQGDMRHAGNAFALLSAQSNLSAWDLSTSQFWAWRALQRAGDTVNAHFWLEQAAHQTHSFYGLMAAHLLGDDKKWSWDVPVLDQQQISLILKQKAGRRALALLQIDKKSLAEAELRHINLQGHRDLQYAMLALASAEHMTSLVLRLGGLATKADGSLYNAALYPLPTWQPADGFKVDPALLYALMRHESQFDPLAVSGRGACGVMQLLPATAKLMSGGPGEATLAASDCSGPLLDPAFNMGLGQRYVSHLSLQPMVGDNLLLLLAAYNEGPGKLAHDLQKDSSNRVKNPSMRNAHDQSVHDMGDPLLFIESLPVHQTHDYIEQVLVHYWSYRARLGETETSLTELSHGQWPHTSSPVSLPSVSKTREANVTDGMLVASNSTLTH